MQVKIISSTAKLEFAYDYMGRRIEKKVYNGSTLTSHIRFVYDEYKLIEELNGLNNNAVLRRYVWQPIMLDVPLTVFDVATNKTYFYHTDANKNITDLTDSTGALAAHYEYSPFGQLFKLSGSYVNSNLLRWSSEYFDTENSLIYYNFRYYSPAIGRWLSKDPVGILGGKNLYVMLNNNTINSFDINGLLQRISPDSEECLQLKKKIENIQNDIKRRKQDLQNNPQNLPESCPGDNLLPSLSVQGHRRLLRDAEDNLQRRIDQYRARCGDPSSFIPSLDPVPLPVLDPAPEPSPIQMPVIEPTLTPITLPVHPEPPSGYTRETLIAVGIIGIGIAITILFPPSAVRYAFGCP